MKIIVIGGGAAGFFTAINIAEKNPSHQVIILEKSSKTLQKIRISGGGRCNVTNARNNPSELVPFYPRGGKTLHSAFKQFTTSDMVNWLYDRGVETKAESDMRMFPVTDSSQTIIDCFQTQIKKLGIEVRLTHSLESLAFESGDWKVGTNQGTMTADKVVLSTGSSPSSWKILQKSGLELTDRVPSLFTFNIKDQRLTDLQGVSFKHAMVKVAGTKLQEEGPLLITHWGLSGPAILKLSSWGAYELEEKGYQFEVLINYIGLSPDQARNQFLEYRTAHPKRKVFNYPLFDTPRRFWEQIMNTCGISSQTPFSELSKKQINKLLEELTQGRYQVSGKSTFKDEFVTAGGVKLSEIDLATFEAKRYPGLYLAGEVLNIDALTGGFNFQACWSAGWIISENLQ